MCTFWPKFLRGNKDAHYTLDVMIPYCGHNNPVYNVHKNMGVHNTWEHIIHGKVRYVLTLQEIPSARGPKGEEPFPPV